MNNQMKFLESHTSFKGEQRLYRYHSMVLDRELDLQIYVPVAQMKEKACVVLYYLPSFTSDAELLASQSDYQRYANRYDLLVVIPDLFSAYRGNRQQKLMQYWQERDLIARFVVEELPALMAANFHIYDVQGGMGYDFGGTVMLNLGLAYPEHFRGVSALAPWIGFWGTDWGKANVEALGIDASIDPAVAFIEGTASDNCPPIWIDQGTEDPYLGAQIQPERIQQAFGDHSNSENLWYRFHKHYDHSFYFVHSQIRQHFVFHANFEEVE